MEEKKNVNAQPAPAGENGGRKRRKKHHGGHSHGQGQNQNQTQQQGQQKQPVKQNQPTEKTEKDKAQNAQKQQQNQQNQGKKNKNKGQQNQGQKQPQSQPKQPPQPQPKQQPKQNQPKAPQNNKGNNKEENRKDTYLYTLDGNLYVNLTNKCSNGCDFCVRNERSSYYGNYLWLRNGDPTVEKVIAAANGFGDLTRFKEVVFCGFGEPTYKVAEMLALCDFFHEKGLKTRLNTNGQGNLINKRDIVPDLKGKIDFVNISLNASCVEKYQPICRSQFGEAGFAGLVEFGKLCRKEGVDCRFSIVDCIGEEEVEACKRLAESVRIPLYVRKYITDS